jgi:hypothetical protein
MNHQKALIIKGLIVSLLLAVSLKAQGQRLFENRIKYFKQRELVVMFPMFSPTDSVYFRDIKARVYRNLRIVLNNYWDLSDSIIYEEWNGSGSADEWYAAAKKKHEKSVFLEFGNYFESSRSLTGHGSKAFGYGLTSPKADHLVTQIEARPLGTDTTLINFIEEFRFLRLSVMYDDIFNRKKLGSKFVMIRKDHATTRSEGKLIDKLKKKFPNAVVEVESAVLLDALLTKDRRFIYLNKGSLVNVEDGAIVTLD